MKAAECRIGIRVQKSRVHFGELQRKGDWTGTIIDGPRPLQGNSYGFEALVEWDTRTGREWVNLIRLAPIGYDNDNQAEAAG